MVNVPSARSPSTRAPRNGGSARDEAAERLLLSQNWNRWVLGVQSRAVQSDIRSNLRSSAGEHAPQPAPAGYRREVRDLADGFVGDSHPSRETRLRSGVSNVTLSEAA